MRKLYFLMFLFTSVSFAQDIAFVDDIDWCKDIVIKESKFEKTKTYSSPGFYDIGYRKTGKAVYISLRLVVSGPGSKQKGVTLLLSDGSKIVRKNEVVEYDYFESFYCNAFFLLTPLEIKRIIANPITDYKLYVHEREVPEYWKYSRYLKCLTEK